MTGAARGVWAGVLGSLLLISPAEAEADPDAAPFPPVPAVRLGCWRNPGRKMMITNWMNRGLNGCLVAIMEVSQ